MVSNVEALQVLEETDPELSAICPMTCDLIGGTSYYTCDYNSV